jgi:hypothetical protein
MSIQPQAAPQPSADSSIRHAVTLRAIVVGSACVTFMAWGGHYTRHIGHTTKMAQDHLPWGVMVPFFLIAVILNKALEKFRPQSMFSRAELLVIFAMAAIGSALPSYFMGHMIANIGAPYYFPSAENGWATEIHPHLTDWAVVTDRTAARWFYEGLPVGASIPGGAWASPLFWRLSLVGAICCFCYSAVCILRKQWIENERLTFPLMALPLAMTEREPRGYFTVGFMNMPVFWIGFGIAIFAILWNMIAYFVPLFPQIPTQFAYLSLGRNFPPIHTRVYPLIIGASYFIELDISSSIIAFYLLLTLQIGFFNRLGFELGPPRSDTSEFEAWQGLGAFCVIIPYGLWLARDHLKAVFRKALFSDPEIDDSNELITYRVAVIAFTVSALFVAGWCVASGMSVLVAVVFLVFVFIVWLGISRITIQTGLISSRTIQAQFATYHAVGVTNMTPSSIVGLAFTYTWHQDLKSALMAPMANATKLFEDLRGDRVRLAIAVAIAVVVVSGGSAYYAIASGYENGAYNYGGGIYSDYVQSVYDRAVYYIRDPFALKRYLALWGLLGVATTGITALLRHLYPGFPLSPIGFASATTYPANQSVFSIFLAWAAKFVILRVGGISLYRKAAPFFYGLMLGYFVGVGLSFVVDYIWFPGEGHSLALY